jgi:hypothetical protein
MRTRLAAAVLLISVGAVGAAPVAVAAQSATNQYCGAIGTGVTAGGEIVTTPEVCFATQAQVDNYLTTTAPKVAAVPDSTLTVYFDAENEGSGATLSITYSCGSGYLNFDNFGYPGGGNWVDKVSSVETTCSYVSFYHNADLGGAHVDIYGPKGDLAGTGLDNLSASSGIQ